MNAPRVLRFTDRCLVGMFAGLVFVSAAVVFLVVIWGLGTVPNLSIPQLIFATIVRLAVTAFLTLFLYTGLEGIFGTYSRRIDCAAREIRCRDGLTPFAKRRTISFDSVQKIKIDLHHRRGVFARHWVYEVSLVADGDYLVFEADAEAKAINAAERLGKILQKPVEFPKPDPANDF